MMRYQRKNKKDFVDRKHVFHQLDEALKNTDYHFAAIYGLGGCGKTQLAIEFAYRRKVDTGCSVFWIDGRSAHSFNADYRELARRAGILEPQWSPQDTLRAVKNWLDTRENWLLIVDAADDMQMYQWIGAKQPKNKVEYKDFIPQGSTTGTVLWTSRHGTIIDLLGAGGCVDLGVMTLEESWELFCLNSSRSKTDEISPLEVKLIDELLQCMPLAIVHAAAYILKTRSSVERYIDLMIEDAKHGAKRKTKLLDIPFRDRYRQRAESVMQTWRITMTAIGKESKCAARILYTICFYLNRSLPRLLLEKAGLPFDKVAVDWGIVTLEQFAFLQVESVGRDGAIVYGQHRLVHLATRESVSRVQSLHYSRAAMNSIWRLKLEEDYQPWQFSLEMLVHAAHCFEAYTAGWLLQTRGFRVNVSGFWSPSQIQFVLYLAACFAEQGSITGAELMYIAVANPRPIRRWYIEMRTSNEDRIGIQIRLSALKLSWGQIAEAERLAHGALAQCRSALSWTPYKSGSSRASALHRQIVAIMAHTSFIMSLQDRHEEREVLLSNALVLSRKFVGHQSDATIETMVQLARCWRTLGRHEDAEGMEYEALEIARTVLGHKHPTTLAAMEQLATSRAFLGRHTEAERHRSEILDIKKDTFGPSHPETLRAMEELAPLKVARCRLAETLELHHKILKSRIEVLGVRHTDTLSSWHNLATIFSNHGDYEEAKGCLDIILLACKERKDDDDSGPLPMHGIRAMGLMAVILEKQERFDEAREVWVRLVPLYKDACGENAAITNTTLGLLQNNISLQARLSEIEDMADDLLALEHRRRKLCTPVGQKVFKQDILSTFKTEEEVLDYKKLDTIRSMHSNAHTLFTQGKYEIAQGLFNAVLILRADVIGWKHLTHLESMEKMSELRSQQSKQFYNEPKLLIKRVFNHTYMDTLRILGYLATDDKAALSVCHGVFTFWTDLCQTKHPDKVSDFEEVAEYQDPRGKGKGKETQPHNAEVQNLKTGVLSLTQGRIIVSMLRLAHVWITQGRFIEADCLDTEALSLLVEVLGPEHPDTIELMQRMANIRRARGNEEDANKLESTVALLVPQNAARQLQF